MIYPAENSAQIEAVAIENLRGSAEGIPDLEEETRAAVEYAKPASGAGSAYPARGDGQ